MKSTKNTNDLISKVYGCTHNVGAGGTLLWGQANFYGVNYERSRQRFRRLRTIFGDKTLR